MPIREYTCIPKRKSRRAYLDVLTCVLLATALWTVPTVTHWPYALVWQFAALCLLTAALLITTRYLLKEYIYRFVPTADGGFDFVVHERSGKKSICVCRVSVDTFRAFAPADRQKRVGVAYHWCVEPRAASYLLTLTDSDGEEETETVIRFSPDREMAAMIEHHLATHPRA